MDKDISICQSGSFVMPSSITNESPFVLDHYAIMCRSEVILKLKDNIISLHDQIEITKALNFAYKLGYREAMSKITG